MINVQYSVLKYSVSQALYKRNRENDRWNYGWNSKHRVPSWCKERGYFIFKKKRTEVIEKGVGIGGLDGSTREMPQRSHSSLLF